MIHKSWILPTGYYRFYYTTYMSSAYNFNCGTELNRGQKIIFEINFQTKIFRIPYTNGFIVGES